jgi:hypothetical protein
MRQKKILLSMLFPLCFLNAAQPAWDEQILSVPGIQQVYPVDMDCDQLLDLIVVHAQPENPSFITQRMACLSWHLFVRTVSVSGILCGMTGTAPRSVLHCY